MQIVTGRRGEPHVTSRQMQAVYRSFLGDFALLDIGEKLRAEAYSNDIVRVYDGVVSVQGIYAVIAYNQYDEVYIEPVSVGKKRIDTIVLHYTKDNALDVEDMQLDVVQGDEYTDNPIAPVVPEGGDAWEGTTDIQVPIYDVEVTNFGLTVTPYARMLNLIPTLESIAERIPETFVTGVKGDSEVLYRDGDVNLTKANIGLGNVDNTADTDKPVSTATQTALNLKADLTYVDAKIAAAYHAGGSKTVAELTSALLITENMGKVYNMSDSGVTTSDFVEGAGKSIIEGDNVGVCNVGTEESPVYKFDLLSGFVDLSAYATTSAVNAGLEGKVDKVTGKGLSTNDYTTADKNKLAGIEAEANKTVIDSAMSDSSTNPLQNKVITKELEGAKTATGNPLTITDAAPVNAVNLSMDLEPIQDLHGYDHPWVGGAGLNECSVDTSSFSASGSSWYSLSGATASTVTNGTKVSLKAGKHTIKLYDIINISNLQVLDSASHDYINSLSGGTFTLSSDTDVYIRIRCSSTGSMSCKTMLESGETAHDWRPYSNECPITGQTEVVIEDVGKNLVDDSDVRPFDLNGETGIPLYSASCHAYVVKDVAGKTVTVSRSATSSSAYFWYGAYSDELAPGIIPLSFGDLGSDNLTATISVPNGTVDLVIFCGIDTPSSLQCELGTTATTYEPYQGKTYTIQIGQDVYGAQYDVTRGKMVVYGVKVDLGDLGWNYSSQYQVFFSSIDDCKYAGNVTTGFPCVSSQYKSIITSWTTMNDGEIQVGSNAKGNGKGSVVIKDLRYSDTTAFKTAMVGVQLVYPLKTPFTIDLTPQQIKMLENTNTLSSDGTMTLEYQPNNAIGEAVRAVEESYDPEFAVRPALKKIAFSGTTDSDGAVTLINASDIPSNHRIIPLQITDMTIGGSAGTYFVEYEPYNSGDSVKAYCYTYFNGSQITPVGSAVTGNFYYYELEV